MSDDDGDDATHAQTALPDKIDTHDDDGGGGAGWPPSGGLRRIENDDFRMHHHHHNQLVFDSSLELIQPA